MFRDHILIDENSEIQEWKFILKSDSVFWTGYIYTYIYIYIYIEKFQLSGVIINLFQVYDDHYQMLNDKIICVFFLPEAM